MSSEEEKARGFTISDRRAFTDSGEAREEPAEAPEEASAEAEFSREARTVDAPAPGGVRDRGSDTGQEPRPGGGRGRLPPVDFPTFVLSLGSSALMHLGVAPHPTSGASETNLPMAKHTIDILAMLQEKTKGNLAPPEAELLENLLYDLRLQYVEASRK
jgi:hypothetical protein